jgi:hypothetical protein
VFQLTTMAESTGGCSLGGVGTVIHSGSVAVKGFE